MRHGKWIGGLVGLVFVTACSSEENTTQGTTSSSASGGATAGPGVGGGGDGGTGAAGGMGGSGASGGMGGSGATGGGGTGGAPADVVRVITIGDTGHGNMEQYCVGEAVDAKCGQLGGCDAIVVNGDNFYDNGVQDVDDPLWMSAFESPYDLPNLMGLKFYAVLGNHDYGQTSSGNGQAQIDYSSLPVGMGPGFRYSDKWFMSASYYDYALGNGLVHFFALDSQADESFPDMQTELADMQQRVAQSSATWKVAYAHHPRFTSGEHQFDNELLNQYTTFVNAPGMFALQEGVYCGTDIYLSGHDHDREIIAKGSDSNCPDTTFLVSGAGSEHRSSMAQPVAGSIYYDDTIEGFVYLEFTATGVLVESYDMDPNNCAGAGMAAPAFSHTITK